LGNYFPLILYLSKTPNPFYVAGTGLKFYIYTYLFNIYTLPDLLFFWCSFLKAWILCGMQFAIKYFVFCQKMGVNGCAIHEKGGFPNIPAQFQGGCFELIWLSYSFNYLLNA